MVGSGVIAVLVGAGLVLCATAGRVRLRSRAPGAKPYAVLTGVMGAAALLTAAIGVSEFASLVGGALLWFVVPAAWALFAFEFTGRYDVRSNAVRALLLGPSVLLSAGHVATVVAAASVMGITAWEFQFTTYFELVAALSGLQRTLVTVLTLGEFLGNVAVWGIVTAATVVVLVQSRRHESLDSRTALALCAAAVGPWMIQFVALTLVGMADLAAGSHIPPVAVAYAVSAVLFPLAMERYDLFGATPVAGTVGPERVLEDIAEPVAVVDHDERVIRANPAAREAFDVSGAVVGAELTAVVDHDLPTLDEAATVPIPARHGQRHYEPSVSPMRDRNGQLLGYTIVLRDVTDREMRQQRLQVLNRVLRHNLRNDVTTIRGRAELLRDGDGQVSEIGDAITDSAEDLVCLGDRAREIEQMLAVPRTVEARTNLAGVVEDVAADVRRTDAADVEVSVPADLVVGVDERVVRPVVRNLVDNAVAHNDRDRPWVRIGATRESGPLPVSLVVADDGPGIPENERVAVESGEEDPLEHGSGLGLWAVKWGVTRMGGTLSFADNEPRGTVVEVGLPDVSPASRRTDGGVADDVAESG